MYVRLAFAVAAHLEPEILLIDEVLAVGDARFQQKCLGKMREVSGQGRTVLFVTHQMGLVSQLCERAVLLQNGRLAQSGKTPEVIATYLRDVGSRGGRAFVRSEADLGNKDLYIAEVATRNAQDQPSAAFSHDEEIVIALRGAIRRDRPGTVLDIMVKDRLGRHVFMDQISLEKIGVRSGSHDFTVHLTVPARFLTSGSYSLWSTLQVPYQEILDTVDDVSPFSVIDTGSDMSMHEGFDYGCVYSPCRWEVRKNS
jgi:lipopolysaccharide transport system ATP-binding protein